MTDYYLPDTTTIPVGQWMTVAGKKFQCIEQRIYTDDGIIYIKSWREVEKSDDSKNS